MNDCIYAAGFIDGEGCITTSGPSGFRVSVANTDREVLDWLVSTFGGNINNQHLPENPRWNASWKWIVCSKPDVSRFLSAIYPFLKIKRDQAKVVLDFLEKYPNNKTGRRISKDEMLAYLAAKDEVTRLKNSKRY